MGTGIPKCEAISLPATAAPSASASAAPVSERPPRLHGRHRILLSSCRPALATRALAAASCTPLTCTRSWFACRLCDLQLSSRAARICAACSDALVAPPMQRRTVRCAVSKTFSCCPFATCLEVLRVSIPSEGPRAARDVRWSRDLGHWQACPNPRAAMGRYSLRKHPLVARRACHSSHLPSRLLSPPERSPCLQILRSRRHAFLAREPVKCAPHHHWRWFQAIFELVEQWVASTGVACECPPPQPPAKRARGRPPRVTGGCRTCWRSFAANRRR